MMNNNILKRVLFGTVVALSLASCNYLDVSDELGGISSFENIFNNVDRTKKWYGQIFVDRPDYTNVWGATNAMGNAWTGYADEIYTREHLKYGKYSNWNSSLSYNHRWSRLYASIRQANIFLEMAHPIDGEGGSDAQKITEEEMRVYKANARFMRAVYHYYLFEMYGPIPIVDKSYTLDNLPDLERNSVTEVVNWLDAEFEACMQDMYQESYFDNDQMRGVPTKGAAMAYRAKLWVYAASPLFNGSWEYGSGLANVDGKKLFPDVSSKDEKIDKAVTCLKEFIEYAEAGRYALVNTGNPSEDLYNLFQEYNREIIWATTTNSWGSLGTEQFDGHATPKGEYKGLNGIDMLQELVDDFYCSDGKPIRHESFMEASALYNETTWGKLPGSEYDVYGMYLNREPRFYNSVTFTGMKWPSSGKRVDFAYGGTSGAGTGDGEPNTGHMVYKRYYRKLGNGSGLVSSKYRPSIIFRLAEFYLLYAEMLNEQTKGQDSDILVYVNKVRQRAGIPNLEDCNPSIAGDYAKLRDAIRRESRIELCTEGQRYFDLCRWLLAKDVLNKEMTKLDVYKTESNGYYSRMTFNPRVFLDKNYLYPIPLDEIKRSTHGVLVQNPGW